MATHGDVLASLHRLVINARTGSDEKKEFLARLEERAQAVVSRAKMPRDICSLVHKLLSEASVELRGDLDFALALLLCADLIEDCREFTINWILKNVAPPLSPQDPQLLRAAGLQSDHMGDGQAKAKKLVLSVHFAFGEGCSSKSSMYLLEMRKYQKKRPKSKLAQYAIYSPNEFEKGFCGVNAHAHRWTDALFPCRGVHPSSPDEGRCRGSTDQLKDVTGDPLDNSVCWRYSFRWHLEQAHRTGGCMVQVMEHCGLGAGQVIEEEMAKDVGIPVIQVHLDYSVILMIKESHLEDLEAALVRTSQTRKDQYVRYSDP